MSDRLHLFAPDDAATSAIGTYLAAHLTPGDLVLLDGDLGAGKTAMARAIIRARMGDAGLEVPSPTFLLVLPYEGMGHSVLHADLYRLSMATELDELGLFDDPQAVILVEWPDRAPELAARADFVLRIDMPEMGEGRHLTLSAPRNPRRLIPLEPLFARFKL